MAQLHAAIGLSRPTFANPHEVLRRQAIRFALVLAVESTQRCGELLLDRVAMTIEKRERGAVAISNATFGVDNEDRIGE